MRVSKVGILLLLLHFTIRMPLYAQKTNGSLAVTYSDSLPIITMLDRLNNPMPDADKARLLVNITGYYWDKNSTASLDSCFLYIKMFHDIAVSAHLPEAVNESNFRLCKFFCSKNDMIHARQLMDNVYGEERVRLMLVIGEHFLFIPDAQKQNTDQAYLYLLHAKKLSDSINSIKWEYQSLLTLGKYWFAVGNMNKGKALVMQIISACEKRNDVAGEAYYWSELGLYMPANDNTYNDKIHSHQMAVNAYLKINQKKEAAYSIRDIAEINLDLNKFDEALQQMLHVLSILRVLKLPVTYNTYMDLSSVYSYKGNLQKSLDYLLLADGVIKPDAVYSKMTSDINIGDFYDLLSEHKESLAYYQKAYAIDVQTIKKRCVYILAERMVDEQVKIGQQKKAYYWLNNFYTKYPAVSYSAKQTLATAYGEVYNALGNYVKAEQSYLQMMLYMRKGEMQHEISDSENLLPSNRIPYYTLGKFYQERGQTTKAITFLNHSLNMEGDLDPLVLKDIEFLLYKTNSSLKNYGAALRYYETFTKINDSLLNIKKLSELEELNIKYETAKNEATIKSLQSKSNLQQAKLEKSELQKKLTVGGIGAAFIFLCIAAYDYQIKKKSNNMLLLVQNEVVTKNGSLQRALLEKDSLITEKDWLIKEIHHRVKNNLQLVISLLNIQSAHLKNFDAQKAIRESQDRIHTIALIHQSLYGNTNLSLIDMSNYITELSEYLRDALGAVKRKIELSSFVVDTMLDISQAIPVGLIINEAVTNSLKYAFSDQHDGKVIIRLTSRKNNIAELIIMDNGKGMNADWNIEDVKGIGINLIKGLAEQLDGTVDFENNNGLMVTVNFNISSLTANHMR